MSDFIALYTAFSGLQAAQAGMDTTSHNIANAGTEGYTRQRVDLRSRLPHLQPFGKVGTGVDIADIVRARDALSDTRFRSSVASQAQFGTLGGLLTGIELALGEPDHGVTAALGGLWSAFEELALDPPDTAARVGVISQLDSLASTVRGIAEDWQAAGARAAHDAEALVVEANGIIEDVATLNRAILQADASPGTPNDLLDRRDLLLDDLSRIAGVTVSVTDRGTARVSVNGLALVHDTTASLLAFDSAANQITHSSGAAVVPGGELAGFAAFLNDELPTHLAGLDTFAAELADALNAQHAAGLREDGIAGGALLSYTPGAAAASLAVVVSDPSELAVATEPGPPVPAFDGTNAEALANLRLSLAAAGGTISLDEAFRSLVSHIGGSTAAALTAADSQGALTAAADAARLEAHGVSVDEEMVNLLTYQRAYEAAARVMTAVDQTLDTLINRTGVVGR